MFAFVIYILSCILLNIIVQIHTLVELPAVEDNNIVIAEVAIRNTVNNLFAVFRIQDANRRPRLKQFSTIHNFFVSITLTDCNNLKEIARLTRVKNIDNNTQRFITQINEVLNEDDKSYEPNDTNNIYVAKYINVFIKKLKDLKDTYVTDKNIDINDYMLKVLGNNRNVTGDNKNGKTNHSHEYTLSDNEFWHPSGRRIYQGSRATIKTFPFMASVQFFKKFHCAGSIIKNDLVITSSSCLQIAWNNRFFRENPAFLSVQVGSDKYEGGGENIAVLEIYFHPQYDPKVLTNNLAIIKLTRKIMFKKEISQIKKIDFDRNDWAMPINAGRITVIGWGAQDRSNVIYDVFKNQLSYAELELYPLHECQEHYSEEFVTIKHFCAGFLSKGSGACNRDAGGPAVVDGLLMGVISFGSPICGAPDAPTVFTKLGYYSNWIENIMKKVAPSSEKLTTTTYKPMYSLVFARTTKSTSKFTPIMNEDISSPLPVKGFEHLRIREDQGFQDFLSTIFKSDEIKEYLDKSSSEDEKETHEDIKDIKINKNPMDDDKTQNVHIPKAKDSENNITTTSNVNSESSLEADTWKEETERQIKESTTESQIKVTVLDNASNYDDKHLEDDIMKLIDNLDIDKILNPAQSEKTKVKTKQRIQSIRSSEYEDVEKHISSSTSSAENLSISPKQQTVFNFLFLSEENEENIDEGLSIQADPFKDLTFRDRPNNTKISETLSEAGLYKIISLAIDDEVKRHKKHRYVL